MEVMEVMEVIKVIAGARKLPSANGTLAFNVRPEP